MTVGSPHGTCVLDRVKCDRGEVLTARGARPEHRATQGLPAHRQATATFGDPPRWWCPNRGAGRNLEVTRRAEAVYAAASKRGLT